MPKSTTPNVRVRGSLGDFAAPNARRDKQRTEAATFGRLKAELQRAFAAPDESYEELDADTLIARGKGGIAG